MNTIYYLNKVGDSMNFLKSLKEKLDLKLLFKNLAIPLAAGIAAGLLTRSATDEFMSTVNKPGFMPPSWLFPVAWTILYVLMGITAYLIETTPYNATKKKSALTTYYASLFFNFCWPFIFFSFGLYLIAFLWLLVLLLLVVAYTLKYFKINKSAAYLNIPYTLWLAFAGALNLAVYILN